jgi:hypothetical protein
MRRGIGDDWQIAVLFLMLLLDFIEGLLEIMHAFLDMFTSACGCDATKLAHALDTPMDDRFPNSYCKHTDDIMRWHG